MSLNRLKDMETSSLRILLIEDNADGRETLCCLLQLLGYEVITAADGLEGVDKALHWQPEVALIDIGLPRLNGYEVASQLRQIFGEDVFLIAQTGYGQPKDRQQALAAGFDVHLTKPVDPLELVNWLKIGRRQLAERKRPINATTATSF